LQTPQSAIPEPAPIVEHYETQKLRLAEAGLQGVLKSLSSKVKELGDKLIQDVKGIEENEIYKLLNEQCYPFITNVLFEYNGGKLAQAWPEMLDNINLVFQQLNNFETRLSEIVAAQEDQAIKGQADEKKLLDHLKVVREKIETCIRRVKAYEAATSWQKPESADAPSAQTAKTETCQGSLTERLGAILTTEIAPGTVVLLDLDNTVIATDPHTQQRRVLEPALLEVILGLKNKGIEVYGYTSRNVYTKGEETIKTLEGLSVEFSPTELSSTDDKMINGVYFTNQGCKGEEFANMLTRILMGRINKQPISKVYVADDVDLEIEKIAKEATQLGISAVGIHYTDAKRIVEGWGSKFDRPFTHEENDFLKKEKISPADYRQNMLAVLQGSLTTILENYKTVWGYE
jgi:hypothetical protein